MTSQGTFLAFCWAVAVAGWIGIFVPLSNTAKAALPPAEKPALTCPLAWDVQVATDIMIAYLGGAVNKTDSEVEKITMSACVGSLEHLRRMMIVWQGINCRKSQ